jgi:hypothetical protein
MMISGDIIDYTYDRNLERIILATK